MKFVASWSALLGLVVGLSFSSVALGNMSCESSFLQSVSIESRFGVSAQVSTSIKSVEYKEYKFVVVEIESRLLLVSIRNGDFWNMTEIPSEVLADYENLRLVFDESQGFPTLYGDQKYTWSRRYDVMETSIWSPLTGKLTFPEMIIETHPRKPVSFNQVLDVMLEDPYDYNNLPNIKLRMWTWEEDDLLPTFQVGKRSVGVLNEGVDWSDVYQEKPIHSMGVGLVGRMEMVPTRFSGIFRGGVFPVLARASISQDNEFKTQVLPNGEVVPQQRSVAFATKVFGSNDLDEEVVTANAMFQNDLNGEVLPMGYLSGVQTNQPVLDVGKLIKNVIRTRRLYEILTLIGVVQGSLSTPEDMAKQGRPINPQIRPLHQLAEVNETHPGSVRTPMWIKIQNKRTGIEYYIDEDDFRKEIVEHIKKFGDVTYEIYVADSRDANDQVEWEYSGQMVYDDYILSKGVDGKVRFHHPSLRSVMTGEIKNPDSEPLPVRVEGENRPL